MYILEIFQIGSVILFFSVGTYIASQGFIKHSQEKL